MIAANPKQLADYRAARTSCSDSSSGRCMKATGGKANPAQLNELLKTKLGGGSAYLDA